MNVYLWHKDGLSVGGVLSWSWRLRELFRGHPSLRVQTVDLRVIPMPHVPQAPFDPAQFFDLRLDTPLQLIDFLQRNRDAFHIVNYSFEYLSRIEQDCPGLLRDLRLIGTCHTDEDYYYMSLIEHHARWDRLLTVSPRTQEVCQSLFPELGPRVTLLPYYNIPLPTQPQPTPPHDPLRLLYIGRISQHQKRIFDLVELMRQLEGIPVELTVVGEGVDKEKLAGAMRPFGDRFHLKPAIPIWEIQAEYARHDLFLLVSEFEGNSIALMEGMLAGLAPFVTRVGSGQERLDPGRNGVLVPIGDMAELARQIVFYQKNPDALQAMKGAAQRTILAELAQARYRERFEEFLTIESPAAKEALAA